MLIFCGHQLGDYFLNQVTRSKILVAMEAKVDATWRVVLGLYERIITMDQTYKIGDLIARFLFLCAVYLQVLQGSICLLLIKLCL